MLAKFILFFEIPQLATPSNYILGTRSLRKRIQQKREKIRCLVRFTVPLDGERFEALLSAGLLAHVKKSPRKFTAL